jgi:hypothetical protein
LPSYFCLPASLIHAHDIDRVVAGGNIQGAAVLVDALASAGEGMSQADIELQEGESPLKPIVNDRKKKLDRSLALLLGLTFNKSSFSYE